MVTEPFEIRYRKHVAAPETKSAVVDSFDEESTINKKKLSKLYLTVEVDETSERNQVEKKAAWTAAKKIFGERSFKIIQIFYARLSKDQQYGSEFKAWDPEKVSEEFYIIRVAL